VALACFGAGAVIGNLIGERLIAAQASFGALSLC
jgi:hypothetical protein